MITLGLIGIDAFVVKPTVPVNTELIEYTVSVRGKVGVTVTSYVTVFVGKTRYFGGVYEIDYSDWVDAFLSDHQDTASLVDYVEVKIDLTYTSDLGVTSTQSITKKWLPYELVLRIPTFENCGGAKLVLYNSGVCNRDAEENIFIIKLLCRKDVLVGKTNMIFNKTNYMDKYGDVHNGSMNNKYELECYIDPEWMKINEEVTEYNAVIAALMSAKRTFLRSENGLKIRGLNAISQTIELEGRVKDVERVEVYSTYNTNQKVPTLKITFEVYR